MQIEQAAIKKSNRSKLIIILLIFIFPALVASVMYFSGWKPSFTMNHGELIAPARPIEDREMQSLDGKVVKFSELQGKWTMVYFDSSACLEDCMRQLYFMRQIHFSQAKEFNRIQRVFVLADNNAAESLLPRLTEYGDMIVLKAEKQSIALLLKEFGMDERSVTEQHNIFLVDPLGNLMMRYSSGVEAAGMRKDLERLLKYSSEK